MDQSFEALLFAIGLMSAVGFSLVGYGVWLERQWKAEARRQASSHHTPAE